MTSRERNLIIVVSTVIICGLLYLGYSNHFFQNLVVMSPNNQLQNYEKTRYTLANKWNIMAKNRAVTKTLQRVNKSFLPFKNTKEAKLRLLKKIEKLIVNAGLAVNQKRMLDISEKIIGVTLEGTASSQVLFSFLHSVAKDKLCLKLNRLQLYSLPSKNALNYRIIISTLLIDEEGKAP